MKKVMIFLGLVLTLLFTTAIAHSLNLDATIFNSVLLCGSVLIAFAPQMKGIALISFTEGLCPAIQETLISIYGAESPQLLRKQTGYLDALRSPQNMAGVSYIPLDPGNGKLKSVILTYLQRGCEDAINFTCGEQTDCTPTNEVVPLQETLSVTNCISTDWFKFDERNMRLLCQPDSSYRAEVINAHLSAFMTALNKQLLTIQLAHPGKFVPDISPLTYKTVNLITAGAADYTGEATVLEDFLNLQINSRPILIGAGNLSLFTRNAKIGCCNLLGQDVGQMGQFDFFRDTDLGGIFGNANMFLGMAPGKVQLVTWNAFVGDYRKVNDMFVMDTFIDPVTGLKIDIHVRYDDCAGVWAIKYGMYFELIFLPDDSFAYCDELANVNFTLPYLAT